MNGPDDERERPHDQTYGEAVDETLGAIEDVIDFLETERESLLEEDDESEARIFQAVIEEFESDAERLEAKRKRMPFGLDSAENFTLLGAPQDPEDDTGAEAEGQERGDDR